MYVCVTFNHWFDLILQELILCVYGTHRCSLLQNGQAPNSMLGADLKIRHVLFKLSLTIQDVVSLRVFTEMTFFKMANEILWNVLQGAMFSWDHWSQTGAWLNIWMLSYQYRKSHCGDQSILRLSYLHSGVSCTGKIAYLYWKGMTLVPKPDETILMLIFFWMPCC